MGVSIELEVSSFTSRSKDHNKKTSALDFHSYELGDSREFHLDEEGRNVTANIYVTIKTHIHLHTQIYKLRENIT